MTPLPGSSVGGSTLRSIKSESVTQGMVGSYYGSDSRSGSYRSGGTSGVALPSARTSYGGGSNHSDSRSRTRSDPRSERSQGASAVRGSGSLTTLQYGGSTRGSPHMNALPGSSVGGSIKSESVTQGMVGSYYGSNRGSLGSRSGSNRSGGTSGVALPSARTSYGGESNHSDSRSRTRSDPRSERAKSSSSSKLTGYTSGHTHNSWSSKSLSSEHGSAPGAKGRPTGRDETWPLRAGSTLEVPEKRLGYAAGSRARRRV